MNKQKELVEKLLKATNAIEKNNRREPRANYCFIKPGYIEKIAESLNITEKEAINQLRIYLNNPENPNISDEFRNVVRILSEKFLEEIE